MITILLHTPELYKEIMAVVRQFTGYEYLDQSDLIDHYAEEFIRIELRRRLFKIDNANTRFWIYAQLWENPLVTDYFTTHTVNQSLTTSPELWAALETEVTFTLYDDPLMWHLGGGVWKILTAGYAPCRNNTSLSTTTSSMLGH
ncbi:hypothetical protein pEaSNUABM11_00023 [Erwinia phage pEa_SNUABM_11]|nr:hypothetical protein pEaSNUABM11_00023 [Erwinia phage pEa_SNUABM_11]